MKPIRMGIVGSGMIGMEIAANIKTIHGIELQVVASRSEETAMNFALRQGIGTVFSNWRELVCSTEVDAVYIATPTNVREEIAISAANNGKHILVEKPFVSQASLVRIINAARENGVAFMDGTHFVHHPRTAAIKRTMHELIGIPQAVRTSFFFPSLDRQNIRFNPEKEPTGAVGDMAWYCMRAVVEYLQPEAEIAFAGGSIVRDSQSGAVIRGAGVLSFEDGKSTTFDFGYDAGVCLMDLDILGQRGMLHLNDFVLDWKDGFAFDNPDHRVGYLKRAGLQSPGEFEFIEADAPEPQTHSLLRTFLRYCRAPGSEEEILRTRATLQTQYLLDQYWQSVSKP